MSVKCTGESSIHPKYGYDMLYTVYSSITVDNDESFGDHEHLYQNTSATTKFPLSYLFSLLYPDTPNIEI